MTARDRENILAAVKKLYPAVEEVLIAHVIFCAIFHWGSCRLQDNSVLHVIKKNGLRRIETDSTLFIEQNPSKSSPWAKMAKAGHHIMWIIKKQGGYAGRVVDGVYEAQYPL